MSDFNTLKSLYEDGYRCIYYDKLENNHTIYLKNFDNRGSSYSTPKQQVNYQLVLGLGTVLDAGLHLLLNTE